MNRQKGRVALRLLAVIAGAFILAGIFMAAGRLLAAHIPWITIESPEAGEVVSGIVPVSCDYGISGGSMHTLILYVGGAEADRVQVGSRVGSHTFFLDTSDYPDGPIQIFIRAYSAAPPSSHYSTASVNVIIGNAASDDDPPEIEIVSPEAGELYSVSSVVLSATLIDDVAVDPDTVVVKLDGAVITSQCDVSALSVFCSLSPADGPHVATIDCADTSGNAATRAQVGFVVDTAPPALAVTSHENGQIVTTPSISLSGTASDATSGVASIEVNGEAATLSGGTWTMPGVSLDEGANAIMVVAEDAAGHVANTILIINYNAPDTSKPVITIEEPTAGALLDAAPVVLNAELEDNEAVATATVVVKLNGAEVTDECAVTPFSVICPLSPADGAHSATIDCKDTSNNAAVQKGVSFTLDTTPPVVSVTSHADGQVVVVPTITLSGAASDATSGVVSVEVNSAGATLLGGGWTFPGAALDEGLNAFVVSAEDAAGHVALTSLTINYVMPECASAADCDDGDARTEDVCVYPGTAGAVCVQNGIECLTDADCNDRDALTLDTCANPGTAQASCVNTPIECATDADCDDADALTIDVCENPSSALSLCVNTQIACNTAADCDDNDNLTLDSCLNPGTVQSLCSNVAIECLSVADCNDGDARTEDTCVNPGTAGAACVHNGIECLTDADCNDGEALTLDTCANPGTAQALCVNTPIECATDADCDDADALTIDVCENPSSASSLCVNTQIACNTDTDCDDGNEYTINTCVNGGALDAECVVATIACLSAADCDDDNAYTIDECVAAGTVDADCSHAAIACLNNSDCDDANPLTIDTCAAPGTAQSSCVNDPLACNADADCDDANDHTEDVCVGGGTADSACLHNLIACLNDSECNDSNPLTIDTCLNPDAAQSSCSNTQIACNADADCDDGDAYTVNICTNGGALNAECVVATITCLSEVDCDDAEARTGDVCVNPGTTAAECAHIPIACLNDADCDDDNAYTIDACVSAGTADATCSHSTIACVSDADCDDDNALTLDTCINAGFAESACSNVACEIACETDADCNDGDPLTAGVCENAGTCEAACAQTEVVPEPEEPAPLTLAIVTPENGHITNSLMLTVVGETTVGATVSVNGTSVGVGEDGAFSETISLEEGDNIITIIATLADETITKQLAVIADVTPPAVIAAAPEDGASFDVSPDRISVRVEDNPGGVGLDSSSMRLFLDGEELVAQYVATSGAYEASPDAMHSGRSIVTMTASDLAGNTVNWAGSFVVAGRGPKITIKKLPGWVDGSTSGSVAPVQFPSGESAPSDEQQGPVEEPMTKQSLASPALPSVALAPFSGANIETMRALLRERRQEDGLSWRFPDIAGAIEAANGQRGVLPDELPAAPALKGTMEALVEETDAPLDIESIEAIVDGRLVTREYDAQTKTLTAALEGFTPGEYEATFTASDIDGNETVTMETFNLTYSADALTLENLTSPGDQISFGDAFRIRLDSSYDGLYTPWATLYNTDNTTVYPGGVGPCYGSHFVTSGFNLQHIEGTEYSYEAQGALYTTLDLDGNEASRLIAVTLVSAYNYEQGVGECLYSPNTMEIIGSGAPQVTSGSITNVNHPEWKTIAIGESARVELEAAPGLTLTCAIEAATFSGFEQTELLISKDMEEYAPGKYACADVIHARPDIYGATSHFIMAKLYMGSALLRVIDDFLTYRDTIQEVHFRNLSRLGADDIAPGETFEITTTGNSGLTQLPGLIFDALIFSSQLDGPFQSTGELVENPTGSGEYRIEATLGVAPSGVVEIRAVIGDPNGPVTPVLSTETLAVVASAPAVPTLITHINGVEVQDRTVSSDNLAPIVSGTAEPESTVNIYKFIEGGGVEVQPVAGGPALSAAYMGESLNNFGDDFSDNANMYWGWSSNNCEIIETDGVLRMMINPGGYCWPYDSYLRDFTNIRADYFKIETDVYIPSSGTSNPATIKGDISVRFLIDGEEQRDKVTLFWGIDIAENVANQTSLIVRYDVGQSYHDPICEIPFNGLALDEWRKIGLEYQSENGQTTYGIYIDNALIHTCYGSAGAEGRVIAPGIDVDARHDSNSFTLEADNFNTTYKVPAGYEISGPALALDGTDYNLFGDNGLYLSLCGVSQYGPQALPQRDSCVDGICGGG
jgi:hypothetical protein